MSPSSSSSKSNNKLQKVEAEHDVFLSFRGEDTRKGFTSHLYDSLIREGIRTFFDRDNMVTGRAISKELVEAIQGSRGSVVVLSENYAFSTWCLTELCKIVECMETSRYIVLPIFYRVNPSRVRKLTGSYSDAFKQHESNSKLKTQVETWKDALIKVGNLSGWTLEETDVEAKFIKDIIADLSRQLDIKKESAHERERRIRLQDVVYCDRDLMSKMVNPANAPSVVGKLLDGECPEEFIKCYILTLRSLLPVAQLVKECDKRNRLGLLTEFLEQLEHEGSQDVHVHNALGKIKIDRNNNPEHFLTTNQHYDSHVLGEYCEKRKDPSLAVVAYHRGQCDKELINVTNTNSMFEEQARYVVERMDDELWKNVLDNGNEYRSKLIDEVISNALPESKTFGQVSAAIEVFSHASIPHILIELLEKIVFQNSVFSGNSDLQCLLIQNAIKEDPTRVMNYINKLDNFDGPKFGLITQEAQLYEEAFDIYKKFNLNVEAVNVLMDKLQRIDRAVEFAYRVKEDAVWNQVRKAQHDALTANVFNYHYLKLVAEHDVYVCFRGGDTRNGFTGYLRDAFIREGFRIFFDADNLERGMDISSELMKAIQGSRSSVVILSENYASSPWCLRELCKIVECMDTSGLIVLPIFFHVNPSYVRKLTGSYGDAFRKHENDEWFNSKEVEAWRDALKRVGHISGWNIDERVVEATIVKKITAALSSQLDIRKESPHEPARR